MQQQRKHLGEFEIVVLLAALRLGESEAYAVSIVDEIHDTASRVVQRAAVYVALRRLEDKGMVTTRLGDPAPERGGKARRLVKVEPAGLKALRSSYGSMRRMAAGLETLLEVEV
ncbi:MAG: helix-turn-helix transcriptional regulator [Acidobacteriota bacterium]